MEVYKYHFDPKDCNKLYFSNLMKFLDKIDPEYENYKRIKSDKISQLNIECTHGHKLLISCKRDEFFFERKKQIILGRFFDTIGCFYKCNENYFAMAMNPYSLFKNDVFIRYLLTKTHIFINNDSKSIELEKIFPIRILLSKNHIITTHKLKAIDTENEYFSEFNKNSGKVKKAISDHNLDIYLDLENKHILKKKITANIPINHIIGRELCILYYMNVYFYNSYHNNILDPYILVSKYNPDTIKYIYNVMGLKFPDLRLLYNKKPIHFEKENYIENFCFKYDFNIIDKPQSLAKFTSYVYDNIKNLDKNKFDNTLDFMWDYVGYFLVITVDSEGNVNGYFCQNRGQKKENKQTMILLEKYYGKDYKEILKNKFPKTKSNVIKSQYRSMEKTYDLSCKKSYHEIDLDKPNDLVMMNTLIWQWGHSYQSSDYYSSCYLNMFRYLIAQNKIKNKVFFVNYFDRPVLHKEFKFYIYKSVEKHNVNDYMPVYSPCSSEEYADIPIPTPDLWEIVTKLGFGDTCRNLYNNEPKIIPFKEKENKLVFRGSNTSLYPNDINRNTRLNILKYIDEISIKNKIDYPKKFFDVGINTLTKSTILQQDTGKLDYSNINLIKKVYRNFELKDFINMPDQGKNKYILDIDGIATAWKLPYMMKLGSCIFKVKSEFYEYFYKFSDFNDAVQMVDIENINDILKEYINDESKGKNKAISALKFTEKYFNRESILKYMMSVM